jgi:protein-tyrosine phosphatase
MTTEPVGGVLPAPRSPGRYRIGLVCLGNICRSPMAEVVLTAAVEEAGLGDRVEVVSSGTGDWHVGEPMDRRAAVTLTAHGYDASRHRAQQFRSSWLADCDAILAMDTANLTDIAAQATDGERLLRFRDFDPRAGQDDRDVPDPYYGDDDGFERVLTIIRRTSKEIVDRLRPLVV